MNSKSQDRLTQLKQVIICDYCHQQFDKPVILPCGETLCKKHLREMIECTEESQHHIFCYFCGLQHLLDREKGYPENKLIQKIIDLDVENTEIRFEEAKSLCNSLRSKIIEIETIQKSPIEYMNNYFSKIRSEVENSKSLFQAHAERSKERIFEDISVYHTRCVAGFETCKLPAINVDLSELEKFLNKEYRFVFETLIKDFNEVEQVIHAVKKQIAIVDISLNEIKEVLFLGRDIKFELKTIDESNIFGKLKLE